MSSAAWSDSPVRVADDGVEHDVDVPHHVLAARRLVVDRDVHADLTEKGLVASQRGVGDSRALPLRHLDRDVAHSSGGGRDQDRERDPEESAAPAVLYLMRA